MGVYTKKGYSNKCNSFDSDNTSLNISIFVSSTNDHSGCHVDFECECNFVSLIGIPVEHIFAMLDAVYANQIVDHCFCKSFTDHLETDLRKASCIEVLTGINRRWKILREIMSIELNPV